ncbi:MAG: hypothetical protein KIH64_016730, partial [Mycobacterium sp.]|nr:hypothetical protein [Mycobacterium sp.]
MPGVRQFRHRSAKVFPADATDAATGAPGAVAMGTIASGTIGAGFCWAALAAGVAAAGTADRLPAGVLEVGTGTTECDAPGAGARLRWFGAPADRSSRSDPGTVPRSSVTAALPGIRPDLRGGPAGGGGAGWEPAARPSTDSEVR